MTSLFAEPRVVTDPDDCLFYHSMDIPGHGSVEGFWDIRGHESEYLGGAEFEGRRVLEVGPASGLLTFYMERRGAEVVSVEAAEGYDWEFYWDFPRATPAEVEEKKRSHREMMRRLRNSYWFCHRAFSSRARVHYGSAYRLPPALGEFDLSVMACVLLHNKSPLRILEGCARVTREALIIVEPFRELQLAQSQAEFLPEATERAWHTWWGFSPGHFTRVLAGMGFTNSRVTFHRQTCFGEQTDLFTVVARRGDAVEDAPPAGARVEAELSCPVERLRLEAGALTRLPVTVFNKGGVALSSSAPTPVLLSYHWRRASGEVVIWDGIRTPLPRALHEGDREEVMLAVRAPDAPGDYLLELTMLREGDAWLDAEVPGLPLRVETVVIEEGEKGERGKGEKG